MSLQRRRTPSYQKAAHLVIQALAGDSQPPGHCRHWFSVGQSQKAYQPPIHRRVGGLVALSRQHTPFAASQMQPLHNNLLGCNLLAPFSRVKKIIPTRLGVVVRHLMIPADQVKELMRK
jgi:hypothetical protein